MTPFTGHPAITQHRSNKRGSWSRGGGNVKPGRDGNNERRVNELTLTARGFHVVGVENLNQRNTHRNMKVPSGTENGSSE